MRSGMSGLWKVAAAAALISVLSVPALAEKMMGHGKAMVTVKSKRGNAPVMVPESALKLKVDGRPAMIEHWQAAKGPLQVVLLIDSSAWGTLGTQLGDMKAFIRSLPADAEVGVAYMENGRAVFSAPLTTDKEAAVRGVRLPGSVPGGSASPYFCLSSLAKHWPSQNMDARREVVMITNGVDNYEPRFNPDDPYVRAAIHDAVKAGLVVYSIYWHSAGVPGGLYLTSTGQNLLLMVSQETGGESYWQGMSNPVSLQPYFKEMKERFGEQYNLEFQAPLYGKKAYVANLNLKAKVEGAKVIAPTRVWLEPLGANGAQ